LRGGQPSRGRWIRPGRTANGSRARAWRPVNVATPGVSSLTGNGVNERTLGVAERTGPQRRGSAADRPLHSAPASARPLVALANSCRAHHRPAFPASGWLTDTRRAGPSAPAQTRTPFPSARREPKTAVPFLSHDALRCRSTARTRRDLISRARRTKTVATAQPLVGDVSWREIDEHQVLLDVKIGPEDDDGFWPHRKRSFTAANASATSGCVSATASAMRLTESAARYTASLAVSRASASGASRSSSCAVSCVSLAVASGAAPSASPD